MKHATNEALDKLEDFLTEVRKLVHLKEKKRGIFYLKSTAFLHFHEDAAGLFADIRCNESFRRFPVNSVAEKKVLLSEIRSAIEQSIQERQNS